MLHMLRRIDDSRVDDTGSPFSFASSSASSKSPAIPLHFFPRGLSSSSSKSAPDVRLAAESLLSGAPTQFAIQGLHAFNQLG